MEREDMRTRGIGQEVPPKNSLPLPPSWLKGKSKPANILPETTLNFPQTHPGNLRKPPSIRPRIQPKLPTNPDKKRGCNRYGRNPQRLNPHYRRVLFSTTDRLLERFFQLIKFCKILCCSLASLLLRLFEIATSLLVVAHL